MKKKKIKIYAELIYLISIIVLAFSVAMAKAASFGVSMIAAPTIILNAKFSFLSIGQWEYFFQGFLFILFCILMKKFKFTYLAAFITSLLYGTALDLWIYIVPVFNAAKIPPESLSFGLRIAFFVISEILTAFAVALSFHTYICPQVVDMFVKGLSDKYKFNLTKCKWVFDITLLAFSISLSLLLFGGFRVIGIGTFILTAVNGFFVGFFDKLFNKYLEVVPISGKLQNRFLS